MKPKRLENETNLNRLLGITVQRRREALGLSQFQLAEQVGLTQSAISLIENGKRMQLGALERIAHSLGYQYLGDLILFAEKLPPIGKLRREIRKLGQ